MPSEIIGHRAHDGSPLYVQWCDNSTVAGEYDGVAGRVTIKHGHLTSGKSQGVEVVLVDTGAIRALLLPGRGMGIWKLWAGETEFGWSSPVDGPVHPSLVPVMDPSGLGWLEGFDELVVRCGLESNGAPEKDESGGLRYPLHGRIANLPARDLRVQRDSKSDVIEVVGDVYETRLFFHRFRLRSRIAFTPGSAEVRLIDEVTNEQATSKTMQMLYHINVGAPLLSAGARVEGAFETLAPKDDLSASEIQAWNEMAAPQTEYAERVYFAKPMADEAGWTSILLHQGSRDTAFGVRFDTSTLPYFILWKNTAAQQDGYVVGLEPATNFPNGRSYEASQGRVVTLEPGETRSFRVTLCPLLDEAAKHAFAAHIEDLARTRDQAICETPKPGWSVG
ncbi:MAG: aldose 1-epimerase family protein [Planctomycetaceae bacterium]